MKSFLLGARDRSRSLADDLIINRAHGQSSTPGLSNYSNYNRRKSLSCIHVLESLKSAVPLRIVKSCTPKCLSYSPGATNFNVYAGFFGLPDRIIHPPRRRAREAKLFEDIQLWKCMCLLLGNDCNVLSEDYRTNVSFLPTANQRVEAHKDVLVYRGDDYG